MKKKFTFNVKYEGKPAKAHIEIELKENNCFSCCGDLIQKNDWVFGGQCLTDLTPLLLGNHLFEVLFDLWKKYHLNDMHAGTPKQEEALRKFRNANGDVYQDYQKECEYLESIGLLVDKEYTKLSPDGYKYGTSWLKEEIPDEDLKLIKQLIEKGTLGLD